MSRNFSEKWNFLSNLLVSVSTLINIRNALFPGQTHPSEGMNTIDSTWYLVSSHTLTTYSSTLWVILKQFFKFSYFLGCSQWRFNVRFRIIILALHIQVAQTFGFHLRIMRELWVVLRFCCLPWIENLWISILGKWHLYLGKKCWCVWSKG